MTKQVLSQAAKLREILANPQTATTYRQAGTLTWSIIRETGLLVWLVICLVLVAGEWLVKNTNQVVDSVQTWLETSDQPQPDAAASKSTEERFSETSKTVLEASKTGLTKAVALAKSQLGIESSAPSAPAAPASAPNPPVATPPSSSAPTSPPEA
jgi:hypothetical protein